MLSRCLSQRNSGDSSVLVDNPIYFLVVFFIQLIIAIVDYILAFQCYEDDQQLAGFVNILAGVSWTLTGFYKLGEFFISLG